MPAGELKESADRPNNVVICPVPSSNNNVYVTLGGGGLFVVKANNGKALIPYSDTDTMNTAK